MGHISWFTTRALTTAIVLSSTAAAFDPITYGGYTISLPSTQAPAATSLPDISDRAGLLALANKPKPAAFYTVYDRCPIACSVAGSNPANWTRYHETSRLALCNQTMLMDFAVHSPLDDPDTRINIAACTTDGDSSSNTTSITRRQDVDTSCYPAANDQEIQVPLQAGSLGSGSQDATDVVAVAQQMATSLSKKNFTCEQNVLFASSGSGKATLGLYAGSQIQAQGVTFTVLQQFIDQIQQNGISGSYLIQLCDSDRGSDFTLGIAADLDEDLDFVQQAVTAWSLGQCVTSDVAPMDFESWNTATLWVPTPISNSTYSNNTLSTTANSNRDLEERTTYCTTVAVVDNDTCGTLATKCGITAALFTTYNPSSTLCSTLITGEHVCCSSGTLPSFAPTNNADGTCYTYLVASGNTCSGLAATYSLTVALIDSYNKNTWGYTGCATLQANENICLSNGTAPMPATLANAVCGPQMNGTVRPANMTNLHLLNPCPLNACCDI